MPDKLKSLKSGGMGGWSLMLLGNYQSVHLHKKWRDAKTCLFSRFIYLFSAVCLEIAQSFV